MLNDIPKNWQKALKDYVGKDRWEGIIKKLEDFLQDEEDYHPQEEKIFAAFHAIPFHKVRAVIIGQDPYPEKKYATGLSFSMPMPRPNVEIKLSQSIKGIHCAIKRDLKKDPPKHGNLDHWAKQGVLLLNRVLTYRLKIQPTNPNTGRPYPKKENLHNCKEWHDFTQAVVQALAKSDRPIQFILWGNEAQKLKPYIKPHIKGRCYHIHCAPHPHPIGQPCLLERFKNCNHFSAVNVILRASGVKPINWFPQSKCCAILSALFY